MKMQSRNFKLLAFVVLAFLAISFTSCNKEELELTDIENFTDGTLNELQKGVVGKRHCLEFIFPISIEFVDGSTAEVEDYMDLHETIKAWFEENDVEKNKENKPTLVFPLQVLNQEGEVIDVASVEALKELKSECPKIGKGKKGKKGKGFKCFSLVFPVSVTIDGTSQSFENKMELRKAIRAYKIAAGDDFERPQLDFPVTVEYEDGTQVEVSSKEELIALKEACKEDAG